MDIIRSVVTIFVFLLTITFLKAQKGKTFEIKSPDGNPEECLDIFPAEIPLAKTLVFIHGGYWHLLDKTMFHFIAAGFLKFNVTTVFTTTHWLLRLL